MSSFDHIFSEYPDLRLQVIGGTKSLVGAFPVRLPSGEEIDRYVLRIELPYDLKMGIPAVFELGGRVPRNPARHCHNSGSLCVFLREERYRYYPVGSDLLVFLRGPLNSYLFGQLYFDEHKAWPPNFQEWDHGACGRREFYRNFLNLPDATYADLEVIVNEVKDRTYKRHKPCPCGSGVKTKRCHWLALHDLEKKVERETLEIASIEFRKFREHPNSSTIRPGLTTAVVNDDSAITQSSAS